uniref:RING-type domain-containing protein n=1 Tax=Leersia perrieri TaxID=77586 RepID=A0A0D9VNF4_9ORYZ
MTTVAVDDGFPRVFPPSAAAIVILTELLPVYRVEAILIHQWQSAKLQQEGNEKANCSGPNLGIQVDVQLVAHEFPRKPANLLRLSLSLSSTFASLRPKENEKKKNREAPRFDPPAAIAVAMPSRSSGRRLGPPPFFLDDDDVEVDYGEEEEETDEEESEEEGSDVEGAGDEEEEGEPGQESIGEGCGPAVGARVSGGAAAETHGCPVCMEPWTSQGAHRICCVPCGHVYGRSCLEKWLQQCGNTSATCPQCGKRFQHKGITNLYAPEVAVPNNDLEKEVLHLKRKSESLEEKVMKHEKLLEEMNERLLEMTSAQKRQVVSEQTLMNDIGSSKRQKMAEHLIGTTYLEPSTSAKEDFSSSDSCNFVFQKEIVMDGLRVMAIDALNQIILASGKAPGVGQEHVLSKFSMCSHYESRNIQLPPDTKTIRDICILPSGSAIFTSLGRKLSSFSMTTDRVVLQCDLPCPGWSCSADESSHHICAGLQNGNLIIFDIHQTSIPLHSMAGLSRHPVHTLHKVIDNNGSRKFLSASSIGPCMWDADGNQGRPNLILGTDCQRVCIALACAPPSSDLIVASYRPKVDTSEDATSSQVYLSQTPTPSGNGKLGHHALIRRVGNLSSFTRERMCSAFVSEIRLSKSAIIPYGNN